MSKMLTESLGQVEAVGVPVMPHQARVRAARALSAFGSELLAKGETGRAKAALDAVELMLEPHETEELPDWLAAQIAREPEVSDVGWYVCMHYGQLGDICGTCAVARYGKVGGRRWRAAEVSPRSAEDMACDSPCWVQCRSCDAWEEF